MNSSHPVHLGAAIDEMLKNLGIGGKVKEYEVVEVWASVVGERIAQLTHVESVDQGTVIVRVSAAPWRTELMFRKKEIIEKIRTVMHSDVIKDIRFR
jgi:predicted nucleic acid-binding Zn ribbon protein